jgi:hypothetical protein
MMPGGTPVGEAGTLDAGSVASGWGYSKLSEGWGTEMVKSGSDEMCEEKKVYYRVVSGEFAHFVSLCRN